MTAIRSNHGSGQTVDGLAQQGERAGAHAFVLDPATALAEFGGPATRPWETGNEAGFVARWRPRLDAAAKRGFDLAFAACVILVGLPFWVAIALAIVITSPGPILFRQPRCGKSGHLFTCYKFRTMVPDAERRLREDPVLAAQHASQWKLHRDPRVTTVGRFLRKSSLDELPQLWNVLRGEMSLVGPRPVQEQELTEAYGALAPLVTSVRPGLTGLWQVSGRSRLTYEQRVALDIAYVRRRRFWYDLWLIAKTVPVVLIGKGAV